MIKLFPRASKLFSQAIVTTFLALFSIAPAHSQNSLKLTKLENINADRIMISNGAVILQTRDQYEKLTICDAKICLEEWSGDLILDLIDPAFADNLPEIYIQENQSTLAWYEKPTTRYRHAVLGDGIEASQLAIKKNGVTHHVELEQDEVFEDIHPRIADVDDDGIMDVITIVSQKNKGARIRVYKPTSRGIALVAETDAIGRSHRWLNPIGFSDFDGDGIGEIALIRTPHIGGILERWQWKDGAFISVGRKISDVSNHAIGSPILNNHAIIDFDNDGASDVVIPNQARNKIKILGLTEPATIFGTIDLPEKITGGMAALHFGNKFKVILVLADGVYSIEKED